MFSLGFRVFRSHGVKASGLRVYWGGLRVLGFRVCGVGSVNRGLGAVLGGSSMFLMFQV